MNTFAGTRTPGATTIAVSGMTCGGCARTIESVLSRVSGVERVVADFDLGVAIVYGSIASTKLIAALEAAGYGASPAGANNKDKEQ